MDCPSCGHANPAGAKFCSECGARLTVAAAPARASEVEEPETTVLLSVVEDDAAETVTEAPATHDKPGPIPTLVVKRGPNAGSSFVVSSDRVTIGRHPDSDFFLDDITVSRRHAEIRREGDIYTVKDVGSLNGTYLNGQRMEAAELHSGDELRVGKYVIVFVCG
jgi:hypothetical protein